MLGGANVALAEESGGFIGIGIGGGGNAMKSEGGGFSEKQSRGSLNYGFVGGYKQFFTPNLGLRYYANIDLHHNMEKLKDDDKALEAILINYGVNVDFLGNFVSNEMLDFGGFIGLGLGANTLTGKDIEDMKKSAKASGVNLTTTGFDVALNVGLRTNIAKHHGLEVAVRVPFLPIALYSATAGGETFKLTFGQEYSVLARYAFSF